MAALRSRFALVVSFAGLLVSSLHCRQASGVARDPVEREAEAALLAYLRIDTSNPPGNETNGARFLQQRLLKEGIEASLVGSNPDRQSVYARIRSGSSEPALLLLHHIDVVPAVASRWTRPPFAGLRVNGYLWGRGALDVKSLGIAQLMAIADLQRRRVPLRRDIVYLGVADEEMGGTAGCRELLEKHPELFTNVGYVLNEGGSSETVVDKVTIWGIETQEKVPLWLRITLDGQSGHSASPPEDGGVLARLVHCLDQIARIPTPYRLTPSVERYFRAAGKLKPDEKGALMREIHEPVDVERVERVLPPGYRSLLHNTIAITRIDGGSCTNCLPSRATADLDIRLLDDERAEPLLEKIRALMPAGKGAALEVLLAAEPVPESRTDTELFRVLSETMRAAEPGSAVAAFVSPGTSDSRYFRARGIVAYGIAPFKVNYYDADTVHGHDERIRARFFSEGVRLTRAIVSAFCARRGSP
ncbi:MAG: M20/M25/M40 family metallo-hydrolase [Thermoanaerobaculia bacterium]